MGRKPDQAVRGYHQAVVWDARVVPD